MSRLEEIDFLGSSMAPTIEERDKIYVDLSDKQFPRIGNIICFLDDQKNIIAHRCVSESPLVLKGDRSLCFDQLSEKDILGQVHSVEKSGRLILFKEGQFLGRLIACLSKRNLAHNKMRKISLLFLIIISKISLLFSTTATKSRTQKQ